MPFARLVWSKEEKSAAHKEEEEEEESRQGGRLDIGYSGPRSRSKEVALVDSLFPMLNAVFLLQGNQKCGRGNMDFPTNMIYLTYGGAPPLPEQPISLF